MAMTLRLSEDEDKALEEIAEREGISKQEAVRRAVRSYTDERNRLFETLLADGIERYRPVLDRLK